jgi:hypothetical protein
MINCQDNQPENEKRLLRATQEVVENSRNATLASRRVMIPTRCRPLVPVHTSWPPTSAAFSAPSRLASGTATASTKSSTTCRRPPQAGFTHASAARMPPARNSNR